MKRIVLIHFLFNESEIVDEIILIQIFVKALHLGIRIGNQLFVDDEVKMLVIAPVQDVLQSGERKADWRVGQPMIDAMADGHALHRTWLVHRIGKVGVLTLKLFHAGNDGAQVSDADDDFGFRVELFHPIEVESPSPIFVANHRPVRQSGAPSFNSAPAESSPRLVERAFGLVLKLVKVGEVASRGVKQFQQPARRGAMEARILRQNVLQQLAPAAGHGTVENNLHALVVAVMTPRLVM